MTISIQNNEVTLNGVIHVFEINEEAQDFFNHYVETFPHMKIIEAEKPEVEEEFVICSETGEKISRSMIIGCISDNYKSAWGFRTKNDYSDFTMEELGNELNRSQKLAEEQYELELKWGREEQEQHDKEQSILQGSKVAPEPATYSLGEILKGLL